MTSEGVQEPGVGSRRRQKALMGLVEREFYGAGTPLVKWGDPWSLATRDLRGRIKVVGATGKRLTEVWRQMMLARRKGHWGALVSPPEGMNKAPVVRIPLEEFAALLGELESLRRQRERWLDGVEGERN